MLQRSDGLAVDLWDSLADGKPVVLVLGYYDCPLICPLTFETLSKALSGIDYTVGEDFRVVAVSFDHTNTVEDATQKKELSLLGYDREITPTIEDGWVFTIGSESNARKLADAVGYKYKELDNGEYSHPVALVILTPDGRVSRYIYSFDYEPREIKLALLEATKGKIGKSIGDSFLHFCFSWDPQTGKYSLQAFRVMQVAGGLTVLLLGGFIGGLFLTGRLRRNKLDRNAASSAPALCRSIYGSHDMMQRFLANVGPVQELFFRENGQATYSRDSDLIFLGLFWFSTATFVVMMTLMIYWTVKNMGWKKGMRVQRSASHNNVIEAAWTIIPTLLVVVIFVVGFRAYARQIVSPESALALDVSASKWNWSYHIPQWRESLRDYRGEPDRRDPGPDLHDPRGHAGEAHDEQRGT